MPVILGTSYKMSFSDLQWHTCTFDIQTHAHVCAHTHTTINNKIIIIKENNRHSVLSAGTDC